MSEEPKPQPVYDYEKGVLTYPEGFFDPPPGSEVIDTGLRTSKGNPIRIRKVPLLEEPPSFDE